MTVCIAAVCGLPNDPAIVICTDGKGSTALGSKENMLKMRPVFNGWYCLTAGSEDDLIALRYLFKSKLMALPLLDETNVLPAVREAMQERKAQKADEFTQKNWGLTYSAFRKARAIFLRKHTRET